MKAVLERWRTQSVKLETPKGTSNYVVFDPEHIAIQERYARSPVPNGLLGTTQEPRDDRMNRIMSGREWL